MEIYVGNQIHSNLLDSFTRKYNELLYIIAEMESIYTTLDDDLRANSTIQDMYRELKNEMEALALSFKRRTVFLSDAEEDYIATERGVLRRIEEILPQRMIDSLNAVQNTVSVSETVFTSVSSLSSLAIGSVPYSYIPVSVPDTVKVNATDVDGITQENRPVIDWDDNYDSEKRAYDEYERIVSLYDVSPPDRPQTPSEYARAVFRKLKLDFPANINDSITDYGWYPTTGEDAVYMAEEGYPAFICGPSGFIAMALNGWEEGVITAYNEMGRLSLKIEPDMSFYVHR